MIYFNGTALESVAPVKIEDIRVSPITQAPVSRDRALNAGADFIRTRDGTRTIMITFAIIEQDYDTRQQYIEAVTAWATSEKPEPMQLPYHENKVIDVLCTSLPDPSTRQWWESRLSLTFTAFDPYFYATTEKSAECGAQFEVSGNAPPIMRIERTLSEDADDQSYSDGVNTMTFTAIPAGDMVIDLNRQTAKVGNTSIMSAYTFDSTFLKPKTGTQTITGTGTVKWRERWKA